LIESKVINGPSGGVIEISFANHIGGDSISIKAILNIPPGSFLDSKRIWMELNNEIGTISFRPNIVFNKPVRFDVKYAGLNLSGINPDLVDFVFQSNDGLIEQVTYASIVVIREQGVLILRGAMLNHFSRYGWTR